MMDFIRTFAFTSLLILLSPPLRAQYLAPDQTEAAWQLLRQERQTLLDSTTLPLPQRVDRLIDLGRWAEAQHILDARADLPELAIARIRLHLLNNDFFVAEALVQQILDEQPEDRQARYYRSELEIQAWELHRAEHTCLDLLKQHDRDAAVVLQLGRVYMLQKNYPKAQALAEQVIQWYPDNADAYLLAAEVAFWLRDEQTAEAQLKACLQRNPFLADARFLYGYAIWRRFDARLLASMAEQWELALAINPLHYRTHWHWGNGHTDLTYADYIDPDEDEIRAALQTADSLIVANRIDAAISLCREVEGVYFASVLPAMMKASAFYMAYDMPLEARLDSAQKIFQFILRKKPHYGPAHNGLAAVIKQKRFPYLASYDSLERVIEQTRISDPDHFFQVFPDMDYYPGERVQKMVWNQLHSSVVYFPFLAAQNRKFVIPPLHVDLAIAMQDPYFRGATTFDNRQWMDIRGVGSGAAAIEYVERGAHTERNVTLHEYTHLFHGSVFSDTEMRRVRALYYHAMANDLTLDYYSANNEFEYLAQTYTAYFAPVKVHPLNHKSVNTRAELQRKDPQLFGFIDSLVRKQNAYLAGDQSVMADNWAQVYLNLAQRHENRKLQRSYLDSAFAWDSSYLPVYLAYAHSLAEERSFQQASLWLDRAHQLNPHYAPLFASRAYIVRRRWLAGQIEPEQASEEIVHWFGEAMKRETDLAERANFSTRYREMMLDFGQVQEAVEIAENYAATAPTVSTYLRDRQDEAMAFAWEQKGKLGYIDEASTFFQELIARNPQRYSLRGQYARVLLANDRHEEAVQVLSEAQRILEAAGTPRVEFWAMIALGYLAQGQTEAAQQALAPFEEGGLQEQGDPFLWVEVRLQLAQLEAATKRFKEIRFPSVPYEQARYYYYQGRLAEAQHDLPLAVEQYMLALEANAYHLEARLALLKLLDQTEEKRQLKRIATRALVLPIPPGPGFLPQFERYTE